MILFFSACEIAPFYVAIFHTKVLHRVVRKGRKGKEKDAENLGNISAMELLPRVRNRRSSPHFPPVGVRFCSSAYKFILGTTPPSLFFRGVSIADLLHQSFRSIMLPVTRSDKKSSCPRIETGCCSVFPVSCLSPDRDKTEVEHVSLKRASSVKALPPLEIVLQVSVLLPCEACKKLFGLLLLSAVSFSFLHTYM